MGGVQGGGVRSKNTSSRKADYCLDERRRPERLTITFISALTDGGTPTSEASIIRSISRSILDVSFLCEFSVAQIQRFVGIAMAAGGRVSVCASVAV